MFKFVNKPNDAFTSLPSLEEFKKRPGVAFVCTEFIAVYSSGFDQVITIPGDYMNSSTEEINDAIIRHFHYLIAQNN